MRRKRRSPKQRLYSDATACAKAIDSLFFTVIESLRAAHIDDPVRHACRLFSAQVRNAQKRLSSKPSPSPYRAMAGRDAALLKSYEAAIRKEYGSGVKVLARFAEKHKLGKIRSSPVVMKGDIRTKPADIAKRIMLREKRRQEDSGNR